MICTHHSDERSVQVDSSFRWKVIKKSTATEILQMLSLRLIQTRRATTAHTVPGRPDDNRHSEGVHEDVRLASKHPTGCCRNGRAVTRRTTGRVGGGGGEQSSALIWRNGSFQHPDKCEVAPAALIIA